MTGEEGAWRYRAFIAYSHRDKRWAAWLHRRLESYRVPRSVAGRKTNAGTVPRRLTPIFRDREDLASADDLGERLNQALEQSRALIVICSPTAASSKWVNEEVLRFRRSGREHRIFCLIVSGRPGAAQMAGHESEECLPPALRYRPGEKGGAEVVEPLAADLRPGGDGRGLALLKLVAGLLDVGLDELRRRELQRRNRRWAAVTALALVIMASTSLLALEATIQRNAAERQRAQAEGLVGFMLGNLLTELHPLGRLDLLDMVGKRALAYYKQQDPDSLDAESLARRAQALRVIGQVYDLRGNLDAALAVFKQAAATTARLLALGPNDPKRIYDHVQSVFWLGNVAYQRGNLDHAEAGFRRYETLAQRLIKIDPHNSKWQAELEYAYSNLGTVLLDKNKAGEAADAFHKSLALSVELAQNAPQDTDKQYEMAQSRAWLADAEERLGRIDAAYAQRTTELAVYRKLLVADPRYSDARESMVVSNRALAHLSMARGNLDAALKRSEKAVSIADALIAQDASNTSWQARDAGAYVELAQAFYYRKDPTAASKAAAKAEGIARALVERDPTVIAWQILLGQVQLVRARLEASDGEHRRALADTQRLLGRLTTLAQKKSNDESIRILLARARLLEGDELHVLGETGAPGAWSAVLEATGPDPRIHPLETRMVMELACLRLGKISQARAIAEHLEASGYRAPEFMQLRNTLHHTGKRPTTDGASGNRANGRPAFAAFSPTYTS